VGENDRHAVGTAGTFAGHLIGYTLRQCVIQTEESGNKEGFSTVSVPRVRNVGFGCIGLRIGIERALVACDIHGPLKRRLIATDQARRAAIEEHRDQTDLHFL
jgi:hypothetical protein